MYKTILVVGDPHANPSTDNRRFSWLGEAILDLAPDIVVVMGDMADMNSLSSYDKNKKSFEGRRYKLDIAATHDALNRINIPFDKYNLQRKNIRKAKRKLPRKVMLYGNHDQARILRAVENSPELDGVLDLTDLKYKDYGWETVGFKQPILIENIWFNHYFSSGVLGQPIGSENTAALLLQKNMSSCISAHNHLFDYAVRTKPDGTPVIGVSAGCFLEEATYDDAQINKWWKGWLLLKDVDNGVFDLEQFSMERIKRLYS